MIAETLTELTVPIGSVRAYGRNPRRGDLGAIRRSLEVNGQYRPVVVNRRSGEVLAGNHTWRAAVELGWTEIAVTFVDVDDEAAARIVLVDNRSNDLAGYDDGALAELLSSLPDLEGTAWEPLDLDRLLASLERQGRDTDPEPPPAEPRARPGQLFALGEHRLLCGDATHGDDVTLVVGGETVAVLWTDPPYGVEYVGKTRRALTMANDSGGGLGALLADSLAAVDGVLAPGGRFYIAAPAGPRELDFRLAVEATGWAVHQTLIWAKDVFVLGHSDYHYQHEPILYGWKPGPGRPGRGRHAGSRWYGDHAQSSLFAVPRPKRSKDHPTMKPVELVAQQLVNSSRHGDVVLDPFAGSGSTLIAAENLGRRCFALELDPAYCDVIVDRWERHTGGVVELLEEGVRVAV